MNAAALSHPPTRPTPASVGREAAGNRSTRDPTARLDEVTDPAQDSILLLRESVHRHAPVRRCIMSVGQPVQESVDLGRFSRARLAATQVGSRSVFPEIRHRGRTQKPKDVLLTQVDACATKPGSHRVATSGRAPVTLRFSGSCLRSDLIALKRCTRTVALLRPRIRATSLVV